MSRTCLTQIRALLCKGLHRGCPAILGASLLCMSSAVGSVRPAPEAAHPPREATPGSEAPALTVTTTREGSQTHFWAENNELCEVTSTFEMGLVNLKGDVEFPYTVAVPPHAKVELFTLSPCQPGTNWEFNYTNSYKLGSNCVKHDDNCLYQLPYAPGSKYKVTQAANGAFSHKGSNKYAIDWKMPEGTPVRAARSGLVVKVRDNSDMGGPSIKYDPFNNYILVRHADGTLGHYCHLQKGGVLVKAGQSIRTGEVIARSGNTGFSSGPHLHFCVFRTRNGKERESIPVKFQTANETGVTLLSGKTYRAGEVQSASAAVAMPGAIASLPIGR